MQYTSRDLRRYNHLLQETDAVYHEMAQHWGLPDSVMGVLSTLCDAGGRFSGREACRLGVMSKQTVNSAHFNECAVVGEVLDDTFKNGAFFDGVNQFSARRSSGFFQNNTAGYNDVATNFVHFQNLERLRNAH